MTYDFSHYGYKRRAAYVRNVLSLSQPELDRKAIDNMKLEKGDRGCGIYGIFNVDSKNLYVGSTKDFHNRMRHHILDMRTGKSYQSINKDITQTGLDAIVFIKIHEVKSTDQLIEAENFWISELGATYNRGMAKKMNITLENRRDARRKGVVSIKYYSSPVIKCDLSGIEICEYGSIRAAAVELGGKHLAFRISKCCRGKMESAYGYTWKYKNGITPSKPKWILKNVEKPVLQINKETGDFIKIWSSMNEAAAFYGLKPDSIRHVCRNNKDAGGFIWKYANVKTYKL